MKPNFSNRYNNYLALLKKFDVDAYLTLSSENVFYLTGIFPNNEPHHKEVALIITPRHILFFHSPLLDPPKLDHLTSISYAKSNLKDWLTKNMEGKSIGFDDNQISLSEYTRFDQSNFKLIPLRDPAITLRQTKDASEIKNIKNASDLTVKLMNWCTKLLNKPAAIGMTEKEVVRQITTQAYHLQADSWAFDPIVAFDQNTAIPHHTPSTAKLTPNSIILIDIGLNHKHYAADMTRTFMLGTPSTKFTQIEKAVKTAYKHAKSVLKNAAPFNDAHEQAVKYFKTKSLDALFPHSIGHGLGINIHEDPFLRKSKLHILKPGNIITIEPGLYLEGEFGYRHEDTYLITTKGIECLTKTV